MADDGNSTANQALDVVTSQIADGQTNAAWNDADSPEKIADVFNAAQDVNNLDAARFTNQTDTEAARPDSPGGADPNMFNPPADQPAAEDASSSADNGGGDA
jgi:hypothetical protein